MGHCLGDVLVFLAILVVDQVTKLLATQMLGAHGRIIRLSHDFTLLLGHNYGSALGLLPGSAREFALASLGAALVLLYLYATSSTQRERRLLSVCFAGLAGNLVDRVASGHVVDFVALRRVGVFNVADLAVVVGFVLLLVTKIIGDGKKALRTAAGRPAAREE